MLRSLPIIRARKAADGSLLQRVEGPGMGGSDADQGVDELSDPGVPDDRSGGQLRLVEQQLHDAVGDGVPGGHVVVERGDVDAELAGDAAQGDRVRSVPVGEAHRRTQDLFARQRRHSHPT
jgi:hypothetical protein